jgi:hypothetical protein
MQDDVEGGIGHSCSAQHHHTHIMHGAFGDESFKFSSPKRD